MRTGAAAGATGFFHEAVLYDSDEALLDAVVPFLQGGIDAGEPVVVTFGEANAALLRGALGTEAGIWFLPGADQYSRPASTIRTYQQMFASLVSEGAEQIRVVGDVPHPGTGGSWREWLRYEALVNQVYDAFPVWGLCPYDVRTTTSDVLDGVLATHPHLVADDGGHARNERYDATHACLHDLPPAAPLAPARPADVVVEEPTPAVARRAATAAAREAGLPGDPTGALELSVSELVTNAVRWGVPPVRCELWVEPRRVVVAVSDAGRGVDDPCAGLVRGSRAGGGLGLWLAHQMCTDVVLDRAPGRFTVTAAVGEVPADV